MAFDVRGKDGLKAEINVTPLVDVVLVLLIIFMVVTPMLTRGRDVQLPVASASESDVEIPNAVVVTVTADRKLWIESQRVELGALVDEVQARLREHRGEQILIKADASVTVRDLRPLLQQLKRAQLTQIAFAVLVQSKSAP